MRIAVTALSVGLAMAAGVARAQGPSCPAGTQVWSIRTSKIKPGQDAVFRKAMADQEAWYRGKGITSNVIKAGPAIERSGLDSSMIVTVHMNSPANRPAGDAAWDAFVSEFRASSDIVSETHACVGDIKR